MRNRALAVLNWRHVALAGEGGWLVFPALGCAAAFAWRDAPALQALNFAGWGIALALGTLRLRSGRLRVASLTDYAVGVIRAGLNAAFGVFAPLLAPTWSLHPAGTIQKNCQVPNLASGKRLPRVLVKSVSRA